MDHGDGLDLRVAIQHALQLLQHDGLTPVIPQVAHVNAEALRHLGDPLTKRTIGHDQQPFIGPDEGGEDRLRRRRGPAGDHHDIVLRGVRYPLDPLHQPAQNCHERLIPVRDIGPGQRLLHPGGGADRSGAKEGQLVARRFGQGRNGPDRFDLTTSNGSQDVQDGVCFHHAFGLECARMTRA